MLYTYWTPQLLVHVSTCRVYAVLSTIVHFIRVYVLVCVRMWVRACVCVFAVVVEILVYLGCPITKMKIGRMTHWTGFQTECLFA